MRLASLSLSESDGTIDQIANHRLKEIKNKWKRMKIKRSQAQMVKNIAIKIESKPQKAAKRPACKGLKMLGSTKSKSR